jgi:hypothetical protein
MGHTKPPFTWQFKKERGLFSHYRRGLLLSEDKRLFDDMWDKAEFHVPAAEHAAHPLPIATILMSINLEQEKSIYRLETQLAMQAARIKRLEQDIQQKEVRLHHLQKLIEALQDENEQRLYAFRQEMLEIKYEYAP